MGVLLLLRSQVRAANLIALSKLDLTDAAGRDRIRATLSTINPRAVVVDAALGRIPIEVLFPVVPGSPPTARDPGRPHPKSDRFETMTWTSDQAISLARLQDAIERLAPVVVRAKGLFEAVEHPGRQLLLQFTGGRATRAPAGTPPADMPRVRLVFIVEIGAVSAAEIGSAMEGCVPP